MKLLPRISAPAKPFKDFLTGFKFGNSGSGQKTVKLPTLEQLLMSLHHVPWEHLHQFGLDPAPQADCIEELQLALFIELCQFLAQVLKSTLKQL